MNKTFAVILAGGTGTRCGKEQPKQFIDINGIPLLAHSCLRFVETGRFDHYVITSPDEYLDQTRSIIHHYIDPSIVTVITGGKTRQESVYKAISLSRIEDDDIILVHDGARPCTPSEVITSCLDSAISNGAAGTYVQSTDTLAEIKDGIVRHIPDRAVMFNTHTPQGFKAGLLRDAHNKALSAGILCATDDVSLAMMAGITVHSVASDYCNIKVTTPGDFSLASTLLKERFA